MRRLSLAIVSLLVFLATSCLVLSARAREKTVAPPMRGLLIPIEKASPKALDAWKIRGGTALVVPLDDPAPRDRWASLARDAERAGLALYPWIEVARNPVMADAHPDWMAAPGGHHDDWRRRFPMAPVAGKNEVVKAWPWVPIGYAPAFEAHRKRLDDLLRDLPGPWAGVSLNDLQAGPSSCGCGNDQCRWALDYGSPSTATKTPGDDAAARLVTELRKAHPSKTIIPVWVTECEMTDLPRVAKGTGLCGGVSCALFDCWPRYARTWNPLVESTPGPLAVALWAETFGRDPAWTENGLSLFLSPPRGGTPIAPERAIAVLPAWDKTDSDQTPLVDRAKKAGGGWVIARAQIEQSWEPRVVKRTPEP
ncbi:MAG: hypothetical protein NVSMB9_30190 [Isosphaeraceae bacterium]